MSDELIEIEPLKQLKKDLRLSTVTLTQTQARYLVDYYYMMQRDRIRSAHQERTLKLGEEPHATITWLIANFETLERNIKSLLDKYSNSSITGQWSRAQVGIGPVIAAGLLAHIDITKAPSVGHIWSFAGLNPNVTWNRGEKRPWNADLKRLCWLIGESFTKTSGNENSVYGKLYQQRKALEIERNNAGLFADQAKAALESKRYVRETKTKGSYEAGKLPDARIHLRAQRWATKLFLSHWHAVRYREHYGQNAPRPYAIEHLKHVDVIDVPKWPF